MVTERRASKIKDNLGKKIGLERRLSFLIQRPWLVVVIVAVLIAVAFSLMAGEKLLGPRLRLSLVAAIEVGSEPISIAMSTDGSKAYVANALSGTVSVIDTKTNTVSATLPVLIGGRLNGVAVPPDEDRLYVAEVSSGQVYVLSLPGGTHVERIKVRDFPQGMGLSPDGKRLYVVNTASDNVSVIDTASNELLINIPVGARPHSIAIARDGTRAYVTSSLSHSVSVIDLAENKSVATINLQALTRLLGLALTADAKRTYLADNVSNSIVEIDNEKEAESRLLRAADLGGDVEFSPTGLALSADGRWLYAVGRAGWISVLDTASGRVLAKLQAGMDLRNIVLAPDGTAYITSFATNRVLAVRATE
jgi:YVTN family beta-propeller protein